MKQIILSLIAALIIIGNLKSQDIQGSIKYEITHDWIKKLNAVDYLSKEEKDRYNYIWSNRSEHKEQAILYFTNSQTRYEEVEEINQRGHAWRNDEYIIFRDFENNKTLDLIRMSDNLYVIEDEINNQNWKILNDIKEVAGHICMDAVYTDEVKGNRIIAWFALDLPIPMGPERYGGLPGAILEIDVNNGAMIISAKEINNINVEKLLVKPEYKKKTKKLSEKEYQKLISNQIKQAKESERPYFWIIRY